MAKKRAWLSILPGNLDPSRFTLDQLRNVKAAHAFLTERIEGPPGFAEHMRAYRFLLFFGIACVVENKYPAFTRCWKDLEKLFMSDPAFEDGVFVQSWALMDFPFGPERQTALDYFEEFLKGTEAGPGFLRFIDEARKSRLGLYQDSGRTKTVANFRELISGRTISAFLVNEWRKGALFGLSPEEAFFVQCDRETNPAEAIDAGQVTCRIGVAPVKPAEFVVFQLSQFSGGTSLVGE